MTRLRRFLRTVLNEAADSPIALFVGALIGGLVMWVVDLGFGWIFAVAMWVFILIGSWREHRKAKRKEENETPEKPVRPPSLAHDPFIAAALNAGMKAEKTTWVRDKEELIDGFKVNSAEITVPSGPSMTINRELAEKLLTEAGYWPKQARKEQDQ